MSHTESSDLGDWLIPTAPAIHLPDGRILNKKPRGQKGADKTVGPVFLCEFSAVRVTTGYVGLEVQGISLDVGDVEFFKLPVRRLPRVIDPLQ
jgi:hypothetical protein